MELIVHEAESVNKSLHLGSATFALLAEQNDLIHSLKILLVGQNS